MKIHVKKTWLAVLGLALAVSTAGGVAVGAGADDWYAGGNATVADPDHTTTTLKLYDASGAEVTSGSTTAPLAAFAAAGGAVRADDTYASLFVHLPESNTAPGAWPGVQATGTDQFNGSGAVTAPAALSGKPYVRTTAAGYTLADVAAALPNKETSASFAGVYELRLRTSSPTAGVSTQYAAAYVKITGSQWALTSAPVLGDSAPTTGAVATTINVTWPAKITYGAAASVKVSVTAASGSAKPSGIVRLTSGSTTVGTASLSGGATTLSVPKTALKPGSRSLQVSYAGVTNAFQASQSAAKTFAVAKATPGKPTFKVTKKPTHKKAGAATVAVPTGSGLAKATGKAQVVLKKGKKSVKVTATVKAGKAKVKLPKLAKGTWVVTVTYRGDAVYGSAKSKTFKVKTK